MKADQPRQACERDPSLQAWQALLSDTHSGSQTTYERSAEWAIPTDPHLVPDCSLAYRILLNLMHGQPTRC